MTIFIVRRRRRNSRRSGDWGDDHRKIGVPFAPRWRLRRPQLFLADTRAQHSYSPKHQQKFRGRHDIMTGLVPLTPMTWCRITGSERSAHELIDLLQLMSCLLSCDLCYSPSRPWRSCLGAAAARHSRPCCPARTRAKQKESLESDDMPRTHFMIVVQWERDVTDNLVLAISTTCSMMNAILRIIVLILFFP